MDPSPAAIPEGLHVSLVAGGALAGSAALWILGWLAGWRRGTVEPEGLRIAVNLDVDSLRFFLVYVGGTALLMATAGLCYWPLPFSPAVWASAVLLHGYIQLVLVTGLYGVLFDKLARLVREPSLEQLAACGLEPTAYLERRARARDMEEALRPLRESSRLRW